MRPNSVRVVIALLVLAFACLVCAQRQQQRPTEQPFVDEYREYFPEDDSKFYFNYTFGDESKRVYFRSSNADLKDNSNGDRRPVRPASGSTGGAPSRRPTSGASSTSAPTRRPNKPIYVSDIDTPYGSSQGAYGSEGYNYDRPSNQLNYDRKGNNNKNRGIYKRAPRLPYKVDFRMFGDERF